MLGHFFPVSDLITEKHPTLLASMTDPYADLNIVEKAGVWFSHFLTRVSSEKSLRLRLLWRSDPMQSFLFLLYYCSLSLGGAYFVPIIPFRSSCSASALLRPSAGAYLSYRSPMTPSNCGQPLVPQRGPRRSSTTLHSDHFTGLLRSLYMQRT